MDDHGCLVLDIESIASSSAEKPSSSPRMTKVLSRKGSIRIGARNNDDLEVDNTSVNVAIVSTSRNDQVKQVPFPIPNKVSMSMPVNINCVTDVGDGKKRSNRLLIFHPRNIFLLLATMSSMGTMLLIYFTLNINKRGGA